MVAEFEGKAVPSVPGDDLVKAVRDEAFRPSILCQGCHYLLRELVCTGCTGCIIRHPTVLNNFYQRCRELDNYKQTYIPKAVRDGNAAEILHKLAVGEIKTCAGLVCIPGRMCRYCIASKANRDILKEWDRANTKADPRKGRVPFVIEGNYARRASDVRGPHVAETVYGVQIYVPSNLDLVQVAADIGSKLSAMVTKTVDGFDMLRQTVTQRILCVWTSTEVNVKNLEKEIIEILSDMYGSSGKSEVEEFLDRTKACPVGRDFALKYDTMREVWYAAVDGGHADYLWFMVCALNESVGLCESYGVNHSKVKALYLATLSSQVDGVPPMQQYTPTFLSRINPFPLVANIILV